MDDVKVEAKLDDCTGIWTSMARQGLIDHIFAMAKDAGVGWPENGAPFLEIDMPCGNTFLAQTPDDMPYESLPCPCGDPKHWFVKYELVDSRPTPQGETGPETAAFSADTLRQAIKTMDSQGPRTVKPTYIAANKRDYKLACRINRLTGNHVDVLPPNHYIEEGR